MTDAIIVALITGTLTLIGVIYSSNKQAQNMDAKLEELTLVARAEEKNAFFDYVRANMDEIIAAIRCV